MCTISGREELMSELQSKGMIIGNDDSTTGRGNYDKYIYHACREYEFKLSGWNSLKKATLVDKTSDFSAYKYFTIDVKDIHGVDVNIPDRRLIMSWDIEAFSSRSIGTKNIFVDATIKDDCIFIIGLTFRWANQLEPFVKVGISSIKGTKNGYKDKRITNDMSRIFIYASCEKTLLKKFGKVIAMMAPDVITGFNCCGFDWKYLYDRLVLYNLHTWFYNLINIYSDYSIDVSKMKFKLLNKSVKLTKYDYMSLQYLDVPGTVICDTMVAFRRSKPSSSYSLKKVLDTFGLPSKVDLPYSELFRYYRLCQKEPDSLNNLKKADMAIYYCIEDAHALDGLWGRMNILSPAEDLASVTYTDLLNSFTRPDSERLTNLLANAGCRDFSFSVRFTDMEKKKYEGGYVVVPIYSVNKEYPDFALDVQSLYPSAIRAWNLSPETIVKNKTEATRLRQKGHVLNSIVVTIDGERQKIWFVWHENDPKKYGLYPRALTKLFNSRLEYKRLLKKYETLAANASFLQNIISGKKEKDIAPPDGVNPPPSGWGTITEGPEDYEGFGVGMKNGYKKYSTDELQYEADQISYYDSKCLFYYGRQYNTKILMNTMYGLSGFASHPFYDPCLAGSITGFSQTVTRLAEQKAKESNFIVKYGDTDSIYVSPPRHLFKNVDKIYKEGKYTKEEYFTELVKITLVEADKLQNIINDMLNKYTKTTIVKMLYEEVLFPSVYFGKKKYGGIPHEKEIDFHPKNIKGYFVRGLEFKKKGNTQALVNLGQDIFMKILDIHSDKTVTEVVESSLMEYLKSDINIKDYIREKTYRPERQNICNLNFVKRMKLMGRKIPPAGSKFSFVYVTRNQAYDIRGRQIKKSTADTMEYPETVENDPTLSLDMMHYIGGSIQGMLARFLLPDNFELPDGVNPKDCSDDDFKHYDAICVKSSARQIEAIVTQYMGIDKTYTSTRGRELQAIYRQKRDVVIKELLPTVGHAGMILLDNTKGLFFKAKEEIAKYNTTPEIKKYLATQKDFVEKSIFKNSITYTLLYSIKTSVAHKKIEQEIAGFPILDDIIRELYGSNMDPYSVTVEQTRNVICDMLEPFDIDKTYIKYIQYQAYELTQLKMARVLSKKRAYVKALCATRK
mgnify:CR=1 FL=1